MNTEFIKTMIIKFFSVMFLSTTICSCGESRKETQNKARLELWSAAHERELDKYHASKQDAKPYKIAEYAESLAEFNRVLRKCKNLGIEQSVIESTEEDGRQAGNNLAKKYGRN